MPEITDAEYRQFIRFQELGTADEVVKKIDKFERENATYRQTITNQDTRYKELEKQVPAEGAVVLTGAEAKVIEEVRGIAPLAEVQKRLADGQEAAAKLKQRERHDAHRDAVKVLGLKEGAAKLLDKIAPEGAKVEQRSEKQGDADVKVAYITLPGADKATPLADYMKQEIGEDVIEGLRAQAATGTGNGGAKRWPEQGHEGKGAGKDADPVEARIQRMHERAAARPNPLLPRTQTTQAGTV